MNKGLVWLVVLVGLLLIVAAVMYFTMSASALPAFLPGHEAGLATKHYKHGIGALLLGLVCFAFAWFQSGKKKSPLSHKEQE
jgi:uncharacterized membrane protein YecN with MAPEG domain